VASLSQGRTAAAQCGLFTYKSVPVIFEPPCISLLVVSQFGSLQSKNNAHNRAKSHILLTNYSSQH